MLYASKEGTYKARVWDSTVTYTDSGTVCNERIYELLEERTPDGWEPVEPDTLITGWHYLTKKDGSINGFVVDMLAKVFAWDGDVETLQQHTGLPCQVVLQNETYDGKTRLKVRYVNEHDHTPAGGTPASGATIAQINAQFGSKFRAHLGGKPVTPRKAPPIQGPPSAAAAAPAPAPAPVAPAPSPTASTSPTAQTSTSQEVWEAFCSQHPQEGEERVTLWQAFVCSVATDSNPTPEQWGVLLGKLTADDDIPF